MSNRKSRPFASLIAQARFHLRWAWQELLQHRARTAATLFGVALAVAIVVSVRGFFAGYEVALRKSIASLGFEVLVTAKGCPYEAATLVLAGGKIPMYMDESFVREIGSRPDVAALTRLFLQSHSSDEERRTYFVMGIEPSFLKMKPWVKFQRGQWFSSEHAAETILGYNAASALRMDLGQEMSLPNVADKVRVVGILDRTGAQDDGAVFLPLEFAQKASDKKNKLTGVGVKIRDVEDLPRFIEEVQELPNIQVVTLSQARDQLLKLVSATRNLTLAVGMLGVIVAVAMVFNTVFMSVIERLRELGILKAIGASAARLFLVVVLESLLLCVSGVLLGFLLALSLSRLTEATMRWLLPYVPTGSVLRLDWGTFGQILAAGCALGVIACLLPALRAARTRPALTMRLYD